jgi:hypothetical protein
MGAVPASTVGLAGDLASIQRLLGEPLGVELMEPHRVWCLHRTRAS